MLAAFAIAPVNSDSASTRRPRRRRICPANSSRSSCTSLVDERRRPSSTIESALIKEPSATWAFANRYFWRARSESKSAEGGSDSLRSIRASVGLSCKSRLSARIRRNVHPQREDADPARARPRSALDCAELRSPLRRAWTPSFRSCSSVFVPDLHAEIASRVSAMTRASSLFRAVLAPATIRVCSSNCDLSTDR